MSELTKALREAEALDARIGSVLLANKSSTEMLNQAQQLRAEQRVLAETLIRFSAKLHKVDPVTGEPMYGVQMRSKLEALHAALDVVEASMSKLESKAAAAVDGARAASEEEQPPRPPTSHVAVVNESIDRLIIMQNESARSRVEAARVVTEDPALLRARALSRACANVRARLGSWVYHANLRYSASCAFGRRYRDTGAHINALENAVVDFHSCDEKSPSPSQRSAKNNALRALGGILTAIRARPEDEKLRRLRLRNASLMERITHFGWPVVRLLLIAGFELCGSSSAASEASSPSSLALGPASVVPWIERLLFVTSEAQPPQPGSEAHVAPSESYPKSLPDLDSLMLCAMAVPNAEAQSAAGGDILEPLWYHLLSSACPDQDLVLEMREPAVSPADLLAPSPPSSSSSSSSSAAVGPGEDEWSAWYRDLGVVADRLARLASGH